MSILAYPEAQIWSICLYVTLLSKYKMSKIRNAQDDLRIIMTT